MKRFLLALFLVLPFSNAAAHIILRPGDVLLQPLDCWSCDLIEAEENSIYSHMGVIVSVEPLLVAESLGTVRTIAFEEFAARTEVGEKLAVLRFKDPVLAEKLNNNSDDFFELYRHVFHGKKYDHDFLWDNFDERGNEKLYCSEFVTKFFDAFFGVTVPVKRMLFNKVPELWELYFNGKVPRGKWGNSPGDFEKSALFERIGEI